MHSYHQVHSQSLLPPGHYKYSQQFPNIIQQLSPSYTVSTEPVFLDHLLMNIEKNIRIVTTMGTLDGILSGVAIDHIQLTVGKAHYHIRYPHIVYFVGKP
ncbi:DUF2642 domain-containing protein [Niallia circulans]|uniref:DUF2642 domain-containing protein n=1 Tax=Niallia circulans TaxID=1397 RepID=A0A553SPK5_NIACI|nr:DUF2642 domain-containing protein [Niallia circulans]TRZ38896.1 DUF2642 domain-containing protein [Niallia circulans]